MTFAAAYALGGAFTWPDHTEWPPQVVTVPVEMREGAERLLADLARIAPLLASALRELAGRIASKGAPLDPDDPANLLVLAQLALLDVDWTRPVAELVDRLNVWPPDLIDRDAATKGHVVTRASRHGRGARFQADMAAIAESWAARLGPPALRPPYAGGQRRRRPAHEHVVEERRAALSEVLLKFPDVTAGRLRRTWSDGPSTPGGLLRTGLRLQPHDPPPSEATLRNDLREIG